MLYVMLAYRARRVVISILGNGGASLMAGGVLFTPHSDASAVLVTFFLPLVLKEENSFNNESRTSRTSKEDGREQRDVVDERGLL